MKFLFRKQEKEQNLMSVKNTALAQTYVSQKFL